jgi:hypothetical protein
MQEYQVRYTNGKSRKLFTTSDEVAKMYVGANGVNEHGLVASALYRVDIFLLVFKKYVLLESYR